MNSRMTDVEASVIHNHHELREGSIWLEVEGRRGRKHETVELSRVGMMLELVCMIVLPPVTREGVALQALSRYKITSWFQRLNGKTVPSVSWTKVGCLSRLSSSTAVIIKR